MIYSDFKHVVGRRKQYLVEFGLKSNIQALGEYFELYKTRTMTFSIGLLLIVMLVSSCTCTIGNCREQQTTLTQQYIQTIKYRNLVIDLGNGVKTKAQLTLQQ